MTTRLTYVVPAYNAEATLARTLDAIRVQTVPDWRCIVVDDGSHDGTLALARSYESEDVRFTALTQENRGTAGAYNTGVRAATTEWVAICSADDALLPEHLETVLGVIERHPDIDIISANGFYDWPDGRVRPAYPDVTDDYEKQWAMADLLHACFYGVGAAYKRSVFDAVGGYHEHIYAEDYDFWIRAFLAGAKHICIGRPLSHFTVSQTQKSADKMGMYDGDIALIQKTIDTGLLGPADVEAAHRAIERREQLKVQQRRREGAQGVAAVAQQVGADKARGLSARVRGWLRRLAR